MFYTVLFFGCYVHVSYNFPALGWIFYVNIMFLFLGESVHIGPSGVRALPLAAGINEGGHYFRYFGSSGVRALPLAAVRNEGGHCFFSFFLRTLEGGQLEF